VWGTWPHVLYGGNPKLHYADHDASRSRIGECIKAWGARAVTGGVWRKMMPSGKIAFGPGYRARSSCEPFFLCVFGNPENSKAMRNIFDGPRRAHSVKPPEAYDWCDRWMPGVRKVELFSRTSRPGWDTWGYEAGKFDASVSLGAEARS
jgi:N6-adenosine-specific RNA methylase IME4